MKNPDKQYEDQRRELRRQGHQAKIDEARVNGTEPEDKDTKGLISNSSLYIAQCAKVCRDLDIDFETTQEVAARIVCSNGTAEVTEEMNRVISCFTDARYTALTD